MPNRPSPRPGPGTQVPPQHAHAPLGPHAPPLLQQPHARQQIQMIKMRQQIKRIHAMMMIAISHPASPLDDPPVVPAATAAEEGVSEAITTIRQLPAFKLLHLFTKT